MSTEENKAAEQRFYAEVWIKHNLDAIDELVIPDLLEHTTMLIGQGSGREGYRQTVEKLFSAFPDLQSSIEDIVAEGDKLAVRWSARGTHRGELMGIPATNRPMASEGIDIIRYEGGKRAEMWRQWDALGLLQQLGVVPSPGQAGR